ncbi:hypothetical protein FGRMN_4264 [Fusarium graminum]|nr:hypothetical protein FGRMN_4264 [Fusarium graminum]
MELLPALHLSSAIVRYSKLVGDIAAAASAANVQHARPQMQRINNQLFNLLPELRRGLRDLRATPQYTHTRFTETLGCAALCARDGDTLFQYVKEFIHQETVGPESKTCYLMLDQMANPHPSRNLQRMINKHVFPETCCLASFFNDLTQLLSDLEHMDKVMSTLQNLDYSERPLRYNGISEAHTGTLAWALSQEHGATSDGSSKSLGDWLASDKSLAWITGYPGSGKSTLMKFVADHQDTRKLLQTWAGNRDLLVVSHYFDAMGGPIQRSSEGLLRSLVCGIISAKPRLFSELSQDTLEASSIASLPSTYGFAPIMDRIARNIFPVNVCFFIDGLDEYGGDHIYICQLIEKIASLPFVKLCVSSRPLAVFVDSLDILYEEKLSLHTINRDDIELYVRDQIYQHRTSSSGPSYERSGAIVEKSKGIFLWAVLAIRLPLDVFSHVRSYGHIPSELSELVRLTMESVDLYKHARMAESLIMARDERYLPAEILFFHQTGYDSGLPSSSTEEAPGQEIAEVIRLHLKHLCNDLLEAHDGIVVFMHRIVFDLMHTSEISGSLLEKLGRSFDADFSILKASTSWFKRRCFASGELLIWGSNPQPSALAYTESLVKFLGTNSAGLSTFLDLKLRPNEICALRKAVKVRGGVDNCDYTAWLNIALDLRDASNTRPWKTIYENWLHSFEEYLYHAKSAEDDPVEEIPDVVNSLRLSLIFARRCDGKDDAIASATWAILDGVEESLLSMATRGQYNLADLSMVRGIYRHLIIEADIKRYLRRQLVADPRYFDNKYSKTYRSPLCSALGVVTRFRSSGVPRAKLNNKWLVENLLALGHDPNKNYGEKTPFSAFVDRCIPDAVPGKRLQVDALNFGLGVEMFELMLRHGANPGTYVKILDQESSKWHVPVWFKFLKLVPFIQSPHQNTFERVFSMMLEYPATLAHNQAAPEKGEVLRPSPYHIWDICQDKFKLHSLPENSLPSDAYFVFRVFSQVCERNRENAEITHRIKNYLSHCFRSDHPELARQILSSVSGNEPRTIGPTTNSSFTPGRDAESTDYRISTSATSIEPREEEPQKDSDTFHDYVEPYTEDGNMDDVYSIQSIEDDIQSSMSSIVRTPHAIAAERQVGDILSQHPYIRFIIKASVDIMPKERLKRNIRRSLKLLYLELRKETQDDIQVHALTTRILKSRGSRTRISERAVGDEFEPTHFEGDDQDSRRNFLKDREFLDTWLSEVCLSQKPDDSSQHRQSLKTVGEAATEIDCDTSDEGSTDAEQFQAVQIGQDFLTEGVPFLAFHTHLCLSLLPDHLRQIMHLASWANIELIYTPFSISIVDQIKSYTEELTDSPWNWWPMEAPKAPLGKGYPEDKIFPVLQREYRRIRGHWKAWFSFWQLSHCNFVKFERIAQNIVIACGQDLPQASDSNYDYTPKPPQASMPPIHPHVFEAAFNSCPESKCWNPFHECYEFEEATYIQRIPKKKTPLTSGARNIPTWGLEARHCISCIRVIFYHLLILIPPFALWGWWLSIHPYDIQSASVPMTVVLAMISMFWSSTGIIKQFRGET